VIGVEPAAVGQWGASLAEGRPVRVEIGRTIADGQQLSSPGDLPFAVVRALAADVVAVRDEQMVAAMRYLFERQKLVTERADRARSLRSCPHSSTSGACASG
jgi:threonine dehydratase